MQRPTQRDSGSPLAFWVCPSQIEPVLDAFSNNQEVALDESLDDLAVPLLLRAQFAGCGHCLADRTRRETLCRARSIKS